MKREYYKTIRKPSTENLKKRFPERPWIGESKSAWVSKKELLQLLEDNDANGLRIHFGCHVESTSSDPKLDMLGLHNVILVATVDSVNPDEPTTGNSVDQLEGNFHEHAIESFTGFGMDTLPLCPPNCPWSHYDKSYLLSETSTELAADNIPV